MAGAFFQQLLGRVGRLRVAATGDGRKKNSVKIVAEGAAEYYSPL
jgi:hypothetical protein